MVNYEDFSKLEIKIGKILNAERVPEATKLLKLTIDLGNETRQIMAGIAESINDEKTLVGKQVPVLANLETKVLRGYESQGMILATGNNNHVVLLHPDQEVDNGSIVR